MTSMSHRLPALSALLITLAAAPLAMAQYKVIGPDGKVTYTDRPPTSPQAQVQMLSPNGAVGSAGADLAAEKAGDQKADQGEKDDSLVDHDPISPSSC